MGKIVLLLQFIFVLHVSLSMEIHSCINQDRTEVRGMDPYELWSNAISVSIDLLFNVCTAIIKMLIILACMITTCIDIFIDIHCKCWYMNYKTYLCLVKQFQLLYDKLFQIIIATKTHQSMPALSLLVLLFFLLLCKV